jgi:uncharacterized protein DUF1877
MSMITQYAQLRPDDLAELRRLLAGRPDEAQAYAVCLDSSRKADIDMAWAGLAFLLAKLDAPVDIIGGGAALTTREWGHGAPRLLTADEVATAAAFLDETPFARLAAIFDPAELTAAEVYPDLWAESWALEYLEDSYTDLTGLFRTAAAAGESVLIWMS